MKFLLLAILVTGITAGTIYYHETRVFSGDSANIKDFKFQVSLQETLGTHFCGGSIISKKWILTAGHCLWKRIPLGVIVVAGITKLSDFGQRQIPQKFIIHEDYDGVKNQGVGPNDIALIKLWFELTFNDKVGPISLPLQGQVFSGIANVTGWGLTETYSDGPSSDLRKGEVTVLTGEECQKKLGSDVDINSNVCGTNNRYRSCSGDSGGPLSQKSSDGTTLIGVVSWGNWGCYAGTSAYVNVANYIDFITEKIE